MFRRDFLKAFTAAAAVLAGGAAAAASVLVEAPPALPVEVAKPKKRKKRRRRPVQPSANDTEAMIRDLLKECRVVSWEREHHVGELAKVRVMYRHAPDAPRTEFDDEVAPLSESGKIVSASVSCESDVDAFSLNDGVGGAMTFMPCEVRRVVEVEYILYGAAS